MEKAEEETREEMSTCVVKKGFRSICKKYAPTDKRVNAYLWELFCTKGTFLKGCMEQNKNEWKIIVKTLDKCVYVLYICIYTVDVRGCTAVHHTYERLSVRRSLMKLGERV